MVANTDEGRSAVAFVPCDAPGVEIIDDWTGFGQRLTGSGTTVLDDVAVNAFQVLDFAALFAQPPHPEQVLYQIFTDVTIKKDQAP